LHRLLKLWDQAEPEFSRFVPWFVLIVGGVSAFFYATGTIQTARRKRNRNLKVNPLGGIAFK
jgi:hypothetical protein